MECQHCDHVDRMWGTLYGRDDEGQVGLVRLVYEQQAEKAVMRFLSRVLTFAAPPVLTFIAALLVGRFA